MEIERESTWLQTFGLGKKSNLVGIEILTSHGVSKNGLLTQNKTSISNIHSKCTSRKQHMENLIAGNKIAKAVLHWSFYAIKCQETFTERRAKPFLSTLLPLKLVKVFMRIRLNIMSINHTKNYSSSYHSCTPKIKLTNKNVLTFCSN